MTEKNDIERQTRVSLVERLFIGQNILDVKLNIKGTHLSILITDPK